MDGADLGDSTLKATISNTMEVLGWEIELAAARSIYLDHIVSEMMALLPAGRRAEFVEGMHTIDLLSQQLTGLSAFSRRMSGEAPDVHAYVHTALDQISLGALADRMRTALGGLEKGINQGDGAGDLEML